MLGPTGVGKTSLVRQFVDGIFSEKYLTTIGVKIDKKQVDIGDKSLQLLVWDIEGVDRYCGFNPRYLRGAAAFVIVVDQTRSQSLLEGMDIFASARESYPNTPAFFVVNKSDLPSEWYWTKEEIKERQSRFTGAFNTSAKTGENVEALFQMIASAVV
nr:Rab family GTPase [Alteromonas sp. C1M14]